MRVNKAAVDTRPRTHEGGVGVGFTPAEQLRRAILTCLLFENNFYESGVTIVDRIKALVPDVDPEYVAALARAARSEYKLRHAPLLLAREMLRHPLRFRVDVADLIEDVIQRADEPAELLSIYWADGRKPLAGALKRGLAGALTKFDAYQVAKWKGDDKTVKFRDVLFLTHAKPRDDEQAAVWKALVDGTLASPDTWEVALSAGKDKRETFERLLQERKLGYMALLRNLRNMEQAGVDRALVHAELVRGAANSRALPFRFLAAARHVPAWEMMIDEAMQLAVLTLPKLPGRTLLLVDVSGSMSSALSAKSDLNRLDAAKALAILLRGVCEDVDVFTFNQNAHRIPPRTGMALADAIGHPGGGTYLEVALRDTAGKYDRTIVVTDEQAADNVGAPHGKGYMLDVAGHQNGVGYGAWTRISGFSEAVVSFIAATEDAPVAASTED